MNPYDFFAAAAAISPDRIAFKDHELSLTYAQAKVEVEQVARAVYVARGQPKVAVFSPNCVGALVAVLGVFRAGAVWVPVNVRNSLEQNIEILQRSDAEVLLIHPSFAEHVPRLQAEVPLLRRLVCINGSAPFTTPLDVAATESLEMLPPRRPDAQSVCAMLSTGGTTGTPKAVVWTESLIEAMVACFWVHLPSAEPPTYLAAAPLTHAAGVISFCILARGGTVVIQPAAKPIEVMRAIQSERITHLFLPPTVIYMMLAHPEVRHHDYTSLRYFIYTAAPMAPDKVMEAMDVFGQVMVQLYGQAEVPLMGTCLTPDDHARFLREGRKAMFGSCGRPTLMAQLEIMDDDGSLLGGGQVGEIVFRGPLVMQGYYNASEETAATSRFGWHHTGDIGFKDGEGYVHIVDRQRDMIISGGFNVYSTEVEQVILGYPGVQDCAVVGVPDDKWGEAVTAFIEQVPGADVDVAAVQEHCRNRLGGVKAPKAVHLVERLPRSPVGKVLKREIRDPFWIGRRRKV